MSQGVDFAELFDRSPNPYMVLDRELRYVAANEAYLRVTGARLDRLLGRRVTDVYPDDPDVRTTTAPSWSSAEAGTTFTVRLPYVTMGGSSGHG